MFRTCKYSSDVIEYCCHCFFCDITGNMPAEVPAIPTRMSTSRASTGCAKCGTVKRSGKFSCCSRGGAWFKNCGNIGDARFNHTWTEGIQVCRDFKRSIPNALSIPDMPNNVGVINNATNGTHTPYYSNQGHTNNNPPGSMSNTLTDTKGSVDVAGIAVCVCILFILTRL